MKSAWSGKYLGMNRTEKHRQMNQDIQNALGIAIQHHTAGQLAEAENLYQQILRVDQNHPIALHLLGVIAHQVGDNDAAVNLITKALGINPDYAEAHNNLGLTFKELGQPEKAVACFQKALALNPRYAEAHGNLGAALADMGKFDEAVTSYRNALAITPHAVEVLYNLGAALADLGRLEDAIASYHQALALKPDYAEALCNLGVAQKDLGRLDEAVSSYQKALSIAPGSAEVHYNLGNAYKDTNQPDNAVASYQNALAIRPDDVDVHCNLGLALQDLGRLDEAATHFQQAIAINPEFAEAHNNLGITFRDLGRLDEAMASYQKALAIQPDYAEAHSNLSVALRDQGKVEEAVASCREAIAIDPDCAVAHRHLAGLKKHSDYDDDMRAMEQTYAKPTLTDEQRMDLAFGLGKAFEDVRQYEKAFDFFATANALRRKTYSYSSDEDEKLIKSIEAVFGPSLFSRHQDVGCTDETPIFILGMPRSGTSLVEQVLASHPQVYGAGELATLSQTISSHFTQENGLAFPGSVAHVQGADFEPAGAAYIQAIRKHSVEARFISNKMPGNFLYIGMIKLMLPNAKVIHCRRDPADTCWSIFKNYFPALHKYTHDLGELAAYYKNYSQLMAHWHRVLPGFIYDVQYEDMVADQLGQTTNLLNFCDLDWDDACLDYHKSERPVRTASSEQVRRPIYKDSIQLWKRYEQQLAPLLEKLP